MTVEVQWPDGKYSLPQSKSTCPKGFKSGWVFQDNQDYRNRNSWTPSNGFNTYVKVDLGEDYKMYYCTKTDASGHGFTWPKGSYCIARYGGHCPTGFNTGSIKWDDEDNNNRNAHHNPVPDGDYGSDTKIEYCCREDGHYDNEILLPPKFPFVLYRFHGQCQRVKGMARPVEVKLHFDDEDSNNKNECWRKVPDGPCRNHEDHNVYMCYYPPQF